MTDGNTVAAISHCPGAAAGHSGGWSPSPIDWLDSPRSPASAAARFQSRVRDRLITAIVVVAILLGMVLFSGGA
jgi:hypothetical protein